MLMSFNKTKRMADDDEDVDNEDVDVDDDDVAVEDERQPKFMHEEWKIEQKKEWKDKEFNSVEKMLIFSSSSFPPTTAISSFISSSTILILPCLNCYH